MLMLMPMLLEQLRYLCHYLSRTAVTAAGAHHYSSYPGTTHFPPHLYARKVEQFGGITRFVVEWVELDVEDGVLCGLEQTYDLRRPGVCTMEGGGGINAAMVHSSA